VLRAFFISLSSSKTMRAVAEKSAVGRKLSRRFVAGTQPEDALRIAQSLNDRHLFVSIDNLGENVTTADEARASAQLYERLLDEIAARQLNANVSLKLTHMGLGFDAELAHTLVSDLVVKAKSV
jgi:proline dehydrogenase